MKALVVLGSPRSKMNTDILLEQIIRGLSTEVIEIEKIQLGKLTISPCISCNACGKTGLCFIKDDMTEIYEKFNQSDIIVIGSPLYFNSVTGITKMMIDRCQAFWSSKYVFNQPSIDKNRARKGVFVCTGGAKQSEDGFIGATVVMDLFFKAINTEYTHNLLVDNTDEFFTGERKDILDRAYDIGKELVKL
ncbi:multimeric flavodoxin WrbA [Anaerosolibacter carboniphilus]|uniref:Multimeric flavodoxin WrbA n=1 Tax=Anaerosolibacter carboniphilus TaxID=1417629 RepID=A0A841L3S7_9FIRM|nr:flavodoxin family protein [Anaerosolibacter carboniphilus]MBB6217029.1 multimeric flavodoxin WrbA [Anaerosolibacter carboniphilus]